MKGAMLGAGYNCVWRCSVLCRSKCAYGMKIMCDLYLPDCKGGDRGELPNLKRLSYRPLSKVAVGRPHVVTTPRQKSRRSHAPLHLSAPPPKLSTPPRSAVADSHWLE
jgi:hypothetical protein